MFPVNSGKAIRIYQIATSRVRIGKGLSISVKKTNQLYLLEERKPRVDSPTLVEEEELRNSIHSNSGIIPKRPRGLGIVICNLKNL